jgi:hypothetical protein
LNGNHPNASLADLCNELINTILNEFDFEKMKEDCFKLTKTLLQLAKIAVKRCKIEALEFQLNQFKRLEILQEIVRRSDLGAYQAAFDEEKSERIQKSRNEGVYQENGLVISLGNYIIQICAFFRDLSAKPFEPKGKGKSVYITASGMHLAHQCYNSRNYQLTLRILQLVIEQCHLKKEVVNDETEILHVESIKGLLENMLSIHDLDFMYSLGCMLALPKDKASLCLKVFKSSI